MPAVSLKDGEYLVQLARSSIEQHFLPGALAPKAALGQLAENCGAHVSLQTYPSREIRGSFGTENITKPLHTAVAESALSAAFEDRRFVPLDQSELGAITLEVSVLGAPVQLPSHSPDDYPKQIKVGRDGLSLHFGYRHGLLLPQVMVDWNWDEKESLCQLCEQSGLPREMWRSPNAQISRFEAVVFCEEKPGGKVLQRKLVR